MPTPRGFAQLAAAADLIGTQYSGDPRLEDERRLADMGLYHTSRREFPEAFKGFRAPEEEDWSSDESSSASESEVDDYYFPNRESTSLVATSQTSHGR